MTKRHRDEDEFIEFVAKKIKMDMKRKLEYDETPSRHTRHRVTGVFHHSEDEYRKMIIALVEQNKRLLLRARSGENALETLREHRPTELAVSTYVPTNEFTPWQHVK